MPDTVSGSPKKLLDPIAIIAIHGVGNQEQHETARAIAALMQRDHTNSAARVSYSSFEERDMVLPVVPIKDELGLDQPAVSPPTWSIPTSEFLKTGQMRIPRADEGEPTVDVAFTRACVNVYDARQHSQSYQTLALEGTRHETGKPDQPVHIFEMYWGDLSRMGNAWIAVLGELYQLLLHAGSIARITAELQAATAAANGVKHPLLGLLKAFRWVVAGAVWLLTVPLVAANVVLLAVAMTVLPMAATRFGESRFAPAAGFVLAALLAYVVFFTLRIYNARRPGVLAWAMCMMVIAAMAAVGSIFFDSDYRTTVLRSVEIVFTLMWPMTVLLVKLLVLAIIFAIWSIAFKHQAGARAAAIPQGVLTATVSLIVPLALSCAVTLMLWAGASVAFKSALQGIAYTSLLPDLLYQLPEALQPNRWPSTRFDNTQRGFVDFLLAHGGSEALNWLIAGLGLALAALVIGTALSIRHELLPLRPDKAKLGWRMALSGRWLNAGLTWIPLIGLVCLILLGGLAMWLPLSGFCHDRYAPFWCSNDLARNAGLVVTTSSAGLLAVAGAYGRSLAALRPGIDLALDVDNWLRERPRFSNPRAQILSRYLALFKHLHAHGYREIVIVAHSQGTVITADFLRLLKHFHWHDGLKIRLFTVGSPLRQLYAERFPDLYGWVTEQGGPEPDKLYGVQLWLNGYRTGDYVGRALWEDLIAKPNFRYGPEPRALIASTMIARGNHAEFSLGAGAHTHYFDYTAPMVASAIDGLVATRWDGGGTLLSLTERLKKLSV